VRGRREPPIDRHVDAVIVVGCEVERGETSVGECPRQRRIARQQFRQGVVVSLGLDQALARDAPDLADDAVHRAHDLRGGGDRPRAGAQCAREEGIEALVREGIRFDRFVHAHIEAPQEAANQKVLPSGRGAARCMPDEPRERVLWKQVLQSDESALFPSGTRRGGHQKSRRRSSAMGAAASGGVNTAARRPSGSITNTAAV
jgi:hypothetical protein